MEPLDVAAQASTEPRRIQRIRMDDVADPEDVGEQLPARRSLRPRPRAPSCLGFLPQPLTIDRLFSSISASAHGAPAAPPRTRCIEEKHRTGGRRALADAM